MIPSGNVTFLFTDIEGSTKLAQDYPDTLQSALEKHHTILRKSLESNNGFLFEKVGDAFCCAFEKAEDAVMAAVDAQIGLSNEKWEDAVIKVRIGIHSGAAEWNGKRYMGYITLARGARVMSSGNREQIIISGSTYELCKDKFDAVKEINVSFRDLGERRMKDVIQPIRLFQIMSPGLREDFPPLKTLDARPNNLPIQLTSFIGREEVMQKLKKLIGETRLLTIIGSGGGGKTRLAMQIGADLIDEYANGVFIAELASYSDPAMVVQTILNSLKLKEETGKSQEETLTGYLKDKEVLLILDNCEHLINECAVKSEALLSKCHKLNIIATSREALNCPGEQTFIIPPLTLPDTSVNNVPEQLTQYESVRLFIERALSVNPDFRVNNDNAPALAGICSRLEGIPLAIELAAARIKVMSLEKINERLNDRFRLLTGGKRTSLPRQQTLKAMIDWSYDLLSEAEKILWRRLSVFHGGWSIEAAEEVCSDELIPKPEIMDILGKLAEKSILIYDDVFERFRILETIKQYGEGKLNDAGETEVYLTKHLDYFISLLRDSAINFSGNETPEWLKMADSEHSNLISAIEWSAKNVKTEKAAALADEISIYWEIRGHYQEGIRIMESIFENTSGISKESLSKLYLNKGKLLWGQGNYENARSYFEKCIGINRELKNDKEIIIVLQGLGNVEAKFGNFKQAQRLFEESLEISRKINFKLGIAFSLNNLGNISLIQGNFKQAEIFVKEGLEMNRKSGSKYRIAFSLDTMGIIMTEMGNLELAQKYLLESLEMTRDIGDKSGITNSLVNLSDIAYRRGNFSQAQVYLEESLKMRLELGDKDGIAYSQFYLAEIFFNQKEFDKARKYYAESLSLRLEIHDKHGIAVSLISFSEILKYEEKFSASAKILGAAEIILKSLGMNEVIIEFQKLKRLIAELSEIISIEEFTEYFEEGKKLTMEEAVQLTVDS